GRTAGDDGVGRGYGEVDVRGGHDHDHAVAHRAGGGHAPVEDATTGDLDVLLGRPEPGAAATGDHDGPDGTGCPRRPGALALGRARGTVHGRTVGGTT